MGSPIRDLFSNPEYVLEELANIREMWSSKSTYTVIAVEAAKATLTMMVFYAPEEQQSLIQATLLELTQRTVYCPPSPVPSKRP